MKSHVFLFPSPLLRHHHQAYVTEPQRAAHYNNNPSCFEMFMKRWEENCPKNIPVKGKYNNLIIGTYAKRERGNI